MVRYIFFLSIVLGFLLASGCNQPVPVWKVSPEVLAKQNEPYSIVWGVIKLQNLYNLDTGETDIYIPGIFSSGASAKLIFRDEASKREYETEAHGNMSKFFSCALPEGEYRLTVDAIWPTILRWVAISNKTVRCSGDGQAIYIGPLQMGTLRGRNFIYYGIYDSTTSFDGAINKFLVDNPEYKGEVKQQILAQGIRIKK
jgi:hypothetical protein